MDEFRPAALISSTRIAYPMGLLWRHHRLRCLRWPHEFRSGHHSNGMGSCAVPSSARTHLEAAVPRLVESSPVDAVPWTHSALATGRHAVRIIVITAYHSPSQRTHRLQFLDLGPRRHSHCPYKWTWPRMLLEEAMLGSHQLPHRTRARCKTTPVESQRLRSRRLHIPDPNKNNQRVAGSLNNRSGALLPKGMRILRHSA